jgi:hypothetical protein
MSMYPHKKCSTVKGQQSKLSNLVEIYHIPIMLQGFFCAAPLHPSKRKMRPVATNLNIKIEYTSKYQIYQ